MSSTQEPEQPCYIARLPTELLIEILLHLNPPWIYVDGGDYLREDNPLFRVRLVSKQLQLVCEPILHRDLKISATANYGRGLEKLRFKVQTSTDRAAACRTLIASRCRRRRLFISIRRWAPLLPNVKRLRVFWRGDRVILDHIAGFKVLQHLSVVLSGIRAPSAGVEFGFLESLYVAGAADLDGGARLNITSFPALRHLRVVDTPQTGGNTLHNLFSLDLLSQLECIDIDGEAALAYGFKSWGNLDDLLSKLPVLWRLSAKRPGPEMAALPSVLQRAHHVRLYEGRSSAPSYIAARDRLHGVLNAHRNLRLVLVSEPFLSAASSAPGDGGEPILGECARRGLEVRSYSSGPEDTELVAPEFLAFLREKAASARTATATGQS